MAATSTLSDPNHIRLHRFERKELAGGHLLQRSSVEDVIHALHRILQRALVAHIANEELDLARHLRHTCLEVVRISSCFFSSRLKIRISPMSVRKKRFNTALPNEPVPAGNQ